MKSILSFLFVLREKKHAKKLEIQRELRAEQEAVHKRNQHKLELEKIQKQQV